MRCFQRSFLGVDSGADLTDHLLQQGLDLLSRFGIDGEDLALALGGGRRVVALVEVVVGLVETASAGLVARTNRPSIDMMLGRLYFALILHSSPAA